MISISILGTGAQMPMPNRHLASVLLAYKGRMILFDCGEGTQVAMRKMNSGFKSLDIICISHVHGDHIYGLPGLFSTIANSGRQDDIILISPIGSREMIEAVLVLTPELPFKVDIIESGGGDYKVGYFDGRLTVDDSGRNLLISTFQLKHSLCSIGFRFDFLRTPAFDIQKAIYNEVPKLLWNKLQKGQTAIFEGKKYISDMVLGKVRKGITVSIIGDTGFFGEISEFVKYSDILISEATYGTDRDEDKALKNGHMFFSQVAEIARDASVKHLILNHFSPAMSDPRDFLDNAEKIFKNSSVASDGMKLNLSYRGMTIEK